MKSKKRMDWQTGKCSEQDCHADHWLYVDNSSGEIVGWVSSGGPFDGYTVISPNGDVLGLFQSSDQAMSRLAEIHSEQEAAAAMRAEADGFKDTFLHLGKLLLTRVYSQYRNR